MGTFLYKGPTEGYTFVVSSLLSTEQGSGPVILPVPAHRAIPEAGAKGAILLITYYVLETLYSQQLQEIGL